MPTAHSKFKYAINMRVPRYKHMAIWPLVVHLNFCKCDLNMSILPSNLQYQMPLSRQYNCWSYRCSWSIACRRCSNYIFILDLTPGLSGLGKDNCKTWRQTFKFWDSVHLILEIWRYIVFKYGSISAWKISSNSESRERERLSLSAFLRTEDIGVHIVHISCLIITYTLE